MPGTPDPSSQAHTLLLATDSKNSIVAELAGGQTNAIVYSAYGHQTATQEPATHLGFNGELREMGVGWYLMGNGYRVYNPILMRFHSPDSWSPFGAGGLNVYIYCMGDPVNFSDPTGHMINPFKALRSLRRNTTRTTSSSSLNHLIPADTSVKTKSGRSPKGISNRAFTHRELEPIYENIPTTTSLPPNEPMFFGPENKIPPPPPKQTPRFNDSGGQVGIISPKWKPPEPERFRAIWNSEPFNLSFPPQYPVAPVPATRTLPGGTSLHYSVVYDANGNPGQKSVEKISLTLIGDGIRKAKK